jgi:hypothetical protein
VTIESKFPLNVITRTNLTAGWWGHGVMPLLVGFDSLESRRGLLDALGNLTKEPDWESAASAVIDAVDTHGLLESDEYILGLPLPQPFGKSSFEAGVIVHDGRMHRFSVDNFRRLGEVLTNARKFPRAIMMNAEDDGRIELFQLVKRYQDETNGPDEPVVIGVAIAFTSQEFWEEALSANIELLKPLPMLVLFRDAPEPCEVMIETNAGRLFWSVPKMLGEKDWAQFVNHLSDEPEGNEVAS